MHYYTIFDHFAPKTPDQKAVRAFRDVINQLISQQNHFTESAALLSYTKTKVQAKGLIDLDAASTQNLLTDLKLHPDFKLVVEQAITFAVQTKGGPVESHPCYAEYHI